MKASTTTNCHKCGKMLQFDYCHYPATREEPEDTDWELSGCEHAEELSWDSEFIGVLIDKACDDYCAPLHDTLEEREDATG
jgi:hypothetical protein